MMEKVKHNIRFIRKALGGDFSMLHKNIWYNMFDGKVELLHTQDAQSFLRLYKGAYLQIDNKGKLKINAPLHIGKRHGQQSLLKTRVWIQEGGVIEALGDFSIYEGASIHIHKTGELILHGGFINNYARIVCEGCIEIGEDVAIAPGVLIRSCDSHHIEGQKSVKDIHVGNHVWIGENAIILKGVTIGDGAVIGAGAVVAKDIPARSVVVGNPARVIKENINWHL